MSYNVPAQILQGGTFATRGTAHNFSMGTFAIASGLATVTTGLATLYGVVFTPINPSASGAGSLTGASWVAAPGTAGGFVAYGQIGTLASAGAGTLTYMAWGI